ncbi:MAG TPA: hypothetical protein VGH84_05670 [Steroidobacteraceae bacterium]
MIATASAPALAQWMPADGHNVYGYANLPNPARPHAGVSNGTYRDYERNVSGWARTRGIGGWMVGLPLAAAYSVSLADDSGDATVPTNSVQKPPAGTK